MKKHWINGLLRALWVLRYWAVAGWRIKRGRWFVWRDAPDIIVRVARMAFRERIPGESKEIEYMYDQACEEWRLRASKRHSEKQVRP